ncbi:hypothetical protein CMO96_00240 [Candidatus Woesebacteria bacterium]|nr:hypothetical protein [Candidatus Woesebacteria bacterium]
MINIENYNKILIAILMTCCLLVQASEGRDTFSETEIVALTLLGEARGEGDIGMYVVACVIKQRSMERDLSLSEVCLQRKQFSCWNGKKDLGYLFKSSSAPYAIRLSRYLIGGGDVQREYINYANHYCTLKTNPYWAKGKKPTKTVGNHKFFKLK